MEYLFMISQKRFFESCCRNGSMRFYLLSPRNKRQQGSKKKKIKKVHTGYCERSKAALQLSGKHNSSNTNYICEVGVVVKYYHLLYSFSNKQNYERK